MKVIIIGGGTSGWMTAAYFAKLFDWIEVSLIESDTVPRIGVGESVSPHISLFFDTLGIDRHEWMRETGATYKLTNRFFNWKGEGEYQHFSFSFPTNKNILLRDIDKPTTTWDNLKFSDSITDALIRMIAAGKVDRFDQWHYSQYHYAENSKAPFEGEDFLLNVPYTHAQHIDAEKTSEYLRDKIALPNGVKHIIGDVTSVVTDQEKIDHINVNGVSISGDLFLDCTGMAQVLIKNLGWKKKYYKNNLVNSSWVCPLHYSNKEDEFKPYTQSISQDNGWMFKIGLQNRMGSGICYSRDHWTSDEALDVYMHNTSNHMTEPRQIKWEPYRLETFGQGNCAAVGLSAGFVEPLEGNALFLVYNSIRLIGKALEKYPDTQIINFNELNKKMAYAVDDIADYLLLHYSLMKRKDNDFWRFFTDLADKEDHFDLCYQKYTSKKNSMTAALLDWCLFPQYLWAQLAIYGGHDVSRWCKPDNMEELSELYYVYNEKRHKIISDSRLSYNQWNNNYLANKE